MMFKRKYRYTIASFDNQVAEILENVKKTREQTVKSKTKAYTDERRHAATSDINLGDKVLVKEEKINKLTPTFKYHPYIQIPPIQVTAMNGTMISPHLI